MQFKTKPYEHQLEAFERFRDCEYWALFADMGTGKSKIDIDISVDKYERGQINAVLVIAPNNVHIQWTKEQFPAHCSIPFKPFVWRSGKVGNRRWRESLDDFIAGDFGMLKVLTVNVEAFQSDTIVEFIARYVHNNTVHTIVDEATRIKTPTAKRTKVIHRLNKYGTRSALTGTPTAKSPFDLWSQMEFLKANYFNCTHFVFQHRYGILMSGVNPINGGRYKTLIDEKTYSIVRYRIEKMREARGGEGLMPADYEAIAVTLGVSEKNVRFIEHTPEFTRFKRLDELKALIAKDVMAVRKEDCLDLPPKVYETLEVTMLPEQAKVYKQLKEELLAQYADKELTVANKVALTTRLMQVAGGFFPYYKEGMVIKGNEHIMTEVPASMLIANKSAKLDAIMADLEETSDEQKVIVWAHFRPELEMLKAELNKLYPTCLYYGGTSQQDRADIVTDFQRGRYKIFVGNPATAGFGLNLQNATLQYYYSNTFQVENRLQAEDRSHRIGVKSTCVYKDVIAKGTLDEKVRKVITSGRDLNDYFKDASLRELLEGGDEDDGEE